METLKPIKDYEGLYEISSLGRVKSLYRKIKVGSYEKSVHERFRKPYKTQEGYYGIGLNKGGKVKKIYLHRLVAEAFIENKFDKPTVNHIDGDKSNNSVYNLEWATFSEQTNHAIDNKLLVHKSKLSVNDVIEIKNLLELKEYTDKEISLKYNVARKTISDIKLGKTWKKI